MSIVATVKVYDGIVLGAESMTQLTANIEGQQQLIKSYENAQKIFEIGDLPVGVLTYGIGNIGRRSIESFVHEFSRSEKARPDAKLVNLSEMARRFFDFIRGHYQNAFGALPVEQQPAMGFIIAGYSEGQHLASEFEFVLPQHNEPVPVRPQDDIGASWRGIGNPFSRIFFGIDPLLESLVAQAGGSPAEIQRLRDSAQQMTTAVAFDGMPLQDAIGFCKFIIQTTIGWCTYALGAAACGGPIRLAIITPGLGFKWIAPPKHYVEGD
ncbi:MAG TPA: hypothetical protein VE825_17095 [Terriglobales bacterium]|jgi:hypothetical protein|nr:hypothetical protein [Terriglobales bacterium]